MLQALFRVLAVPILVILFVFNLRRIVLTLSIFLAPRRRAARYTNRELPAVLVLVPCRNEHKVLGGMAHALAQLDYPPEKMQVVLVDDGSEDATLPMAQQIAGHYSNVHVISMPESVGKARALNAALEQFPFGEMVYIFDADHRPRPDAVRVTIGYFCDPMVAGVSGRTIPSNALASPSAYYTTVESFVNQMITMRAKDRLNLAPAMLGSNCAYRRSVLVKCGSFPPGALLEDSELTLRLCRAGYRLRFAEDSVAYQQVPQTMSGYLLQHARWGRGFNDIARNHALELVRQQNVNPLLRAELLLFALGYLDRLALLGAGMFSVLSVLFPRIVRFPRVVLYIALLTPFAQILALFVEQRAGAPMWLRLPFVPFFFALDILAAIRAMVDSVLNRARVWTTTERVRDDSLLSMSDRAREQLLLGMILLLAFGVRMWDLGRNGLWYDEILQAQAAVGTLDEFINQLIVHAAMPLDYVIERGFLLLGQNEFWLRFPSAAFGTLAAAVIHKLGRSMFGGPTGVIASAFLAVSPFAVFYAHEARPYSLYMLLMLTAVYWLYRSLQTNKLTHWLYFGLALAGSTLTHLFALFVILTLVLFILLGLLVRTIATRRARLFSRITPTAILGGVVVAGLFLAALWLTPNAQYVWGSSLRFFRFLLSPQFVSPDRWYGLAPGETPPLLTFDFFYTRILENFSGGGVAATAAFVGLGLAGLTAARNKPWEILLLALWAILPCALIVLFLGDRGTLFAARYLIASLPPWLMLCAVGTVQLGALVARLTQNNPTLRRAAIALVAIAFVAISFDRSATAVASPKEDWRAAGAMLEANVRAQDAVLAPGGTHVVYFYAPNAVARQNKAESEEQIAVVEQQAARVWLVMNRYVFDPGGEITAWLEGRGALALQVDSGITLYYWHAGVDNAQLLAEAQSFHLPPSPFVHASLARAYALNGDMPLADSNLEKAAAFAKTDAERAMVDLTWAEIFRGAARLGEAAEKYRAALALDGNRTEAWVGLGRVYLEQNQLPAARDALARAIALEPNSYPALFFLADYYERIGEAAAALDYYARAAEIIPELTSPP